MSRQQDLADEIRRSMHNRLVAELRLRQRNIVFPDTVRNWGVFLRNLASKSVQAYVSHRLFAVFFGLYLLWDHLLYPLLAAHRAISVDLGAPLDLAMIGLVTSLWVAVAIKTIVNAALREDQPKLRLTKSYPRVKI